MKARVTFCFVVICALLLTACAHQPATISRFNSAQILDNLFPWQQEKYCPFDDELLSSEIRCNFQQVTQFDDGDPSNPEWYFRHNDKDFSKDNEISGLEFIMYSLYGKTFPANKDEAEKYWAEATKFYELKPEYTIESVSIDGKKAWKIMQYVDSDLPMLSEEQKRFSHIVGVYLLEKDEKFIYSIGVMLSSDSVEKVRAYQAEADHFISSIEWK